MNAVPGFLVPDFSNKRMGTNKLAGASALKPWSQQHDCYNSARRPFVRSYPIMISWILVALNFSAWDVIVGTRVLVSDGQEGWLVKQHITTQAPIKSSYCFDSPFSGFVCIYRGNHRTTTTSAECFAVSKSRWTAQANGATMASAWGAHQIWCKYRLHCSGKFDGAQ